MSLLSDILSKVKHPELSKEVPPGLKSTVFALKKKESNKKRLAILAIFAIVAVSAGFATVYLMEVYLKRSPRQTVAQRSQTVGPQTQQAQPPQAVHDEKPDEKPLAGEQKRAPETAMAQSLKKGQAEKDMQEKTKSVVEPQKNRRFAETKKTEEKDTSKREVIPKGVKEGKTIPDTEDVARTEKPGPDTSEKDLYLYMARNYEAKRDYPNAIASYKKVLSIEPRNYRVMNNIASILIKLNLYDEAKTYLSMALDVRNDYVPGLINLGIVFAKAGEAKHAEDSLLKALTLEPDNRDALLNIAILYEREGSYEKARQHYLRLKQLGDPRGEMGLERIKVAR